MRSASDQSDENVVAPDTERRPARGREPLDSLARSGGILQAAPPGSASTGSALIRLQASRHAR
jgi:hypothetical protein